MRRDALQAKIDDWYRQHRGRPFDLAAYKAFLAEIGYLVPEGPAFTVETANVDDEVATVAGPQLVVPISNARYALNAANARWGSLYDALYGTDAIPRDGDGDAAPGRGYNPERGKRVIAWARRFLDDSVPLASGSHADVRGYAVKDGALAATLGNGATVGLADPKQFCGYRGKADAPDAILLVNHGLHIEVVIDRAHPIGRSDAAGVADIVLEAALTTIMDLEEFDRRGRSRRQGGGLSQLARSLPRHAHRYLRKGRQAGRPASRRRPRLYQARRRHADAAGPQPDAHPQCRPPDDR